MSRGKDICKKLKEVRHEIARANDIEFVTSECKFKGECTGTCPKCEAEVRYLEEQLSLRHRAGKAVAVAGIAASMFLAYAPAMAATPESVPLSAAEYTPLPPKPGDIKLIPSFPAQGERIIVNGIVADEMKDPLIGALIKCNGKEIAKTNFDGMFSMEVPRGSKIDIQYVGHVDITFTVPEDAETNFDAFIIMSEEPSLIGEVVVSDRPCKRQKDCVIYNNKWPIDAPKDVVEVTGTIREKDRPGRPEENAVIYLEQGNKVVSHADSIGNFKMTIPRGMTIIVKAPGYKDVKVNLDRNAKSISLNVTPFPIE